jgi:hypothetical protein
MSQKEVTNYHSTLHKIPQEQQQYLHHSRSLKSCRSQDGWEAHYTEERQKMDMKFEIKNLNKRCHLEHLCICIKENSGWWTNTIWMWGLIWLAVNWDHKQVVKIMVMKLWVSQNSSKILCQMSNYQLVKATGVCSFNYSSNVSSCVSTPVWQHN